MILKLAYMVFCTFVWQSHQTEPIFKFIPKKTLKNTIVQTIHQFDIEIVLGTQISTYAVVGIHGPMRNGHAGMTVTSLERTSTGSNAAAQGTPTTTHSTASDGLYDYAQMNFTSLKRVDNARTVTEDNTLRLMATMVVVDSPGADSATELWVWVTVEIDDYIWVSEEVMTISRSPQDRPYLNYTITPDALSPFIPGIQFTISGTVKHHAKSRINAYQVLLRFYLPPYLEFVQGSYGYNDKYSVGVQKLYNQNNQNEVVIKYAKLGITDTPTYMFDVRFRNANLNLMSRQEYNASIKFLMSYCSVDDCSPNGAIEKLTDTITKKFRNRESGASGSFKIQHVPSGRCFSFTNGANSNKIIFKADCSDDFTFDVNGGLKHVSSSSCAYVDTDGSLKMSQAKCTTLDVAIIVKTSDGKLRLKNVDGSSTECISQLSTGIEQAFILKGSCSIKDINFRFVPKLPATSRIEILKKIVLYAPGLLFFCCPQSVEQKPNCFFKNGSHTLQAMPVSFGSIEAFDSSTSTVYGVHRSGKSYAKVVLKSTTRATVQISDDNWNSAKTKQGLVLATKLTESSLRNHPVQHLSTTYGVSLTGIHERVNSAWKPITRW